MGEYHSTDFGKTFTKGTLPSDVSYKAIAGILSLILFLFVFALQYISAGYVVLTRFYILHITVIVFAGSSDGTFSVVTSMYSGGIYYTAKN